MSEPSMFGPAPVLRLSDFGFTYRGADAPALTSVNLTLSPGEALAVLGPQDAGTSTLARAVAGLLGEHGLSTGIREVHGARGEDTTVGMLGDDPEAQLTGLTRTVREEAALPGRLLGLPLEECLDRADTSLHALGIQTLAERALSTLSGGERQLTALAGLLTLRPDVLVLDQPSQALDHSARRRLARSLREFRDAGGAVLLTGHQHDDLSADCDRVLFLDEGRAAGELRGVAVAELSAEQLQHHGVWNARVEPARQPVRPVTENVALLGVKNYSVTRGAVRVIEDIELELYSGETTAFLGANGSGKSTLLSSLAGLLPAAPGAQLAGPSGVDLFAVPAHQRASLLSWVGQDPGDQISASTVRAELLRAAPLGPGGRRLPRRERLAAREKRELLVDEVMATAGLTEHADDHPYDLTPAQRKDCVIASALLLRPAVLLLDEPTLGRDAAGMRRLSALVQSFTVTGGAVLVATHDQRWAAEIGDHLLHLREGRLQRNS